MSYLPSPVPKRDYCRKHGREYSGYLCPECRAEMEKRADSKESTNRLEPKISAEEWVELMQAIKVEATPKSPRKRTPKELATYLHPDGSFEQSNEYARKVRSRESLGNLHSKDKYSGQSRAVAWLAIGIIVFVIGIFVILGWAR